MKLKYILEAALNSPYTNTISMGFTGGLSTPLSHEWMGGYYAAPNQPDSFQAKYMMVLLGKKDGIKPDKKWTYTERNIIDSMLLNKLIKYDKEMDCMKITPEGKKWYETFRENSFIDYRGNFGASPDFSGIVAGRR